MENNETKIDIGVTIDDTLKFEEQQNIMADETNIQPSGYSNLTILYKALVRPHLKCSNSPCFVGQIILIANIQRRPSTGI